MTKPNVDPNWRKPGASRASIIRAYAMEGHPPWAIHQETGFPYTYIRTEISRARRAGYPIKGFRSDRDALRSAGSKLTDDVLNKLRHEAKRRDLSLDELAAEILTILAEDDLFSALLDRETE